MAFMMMLSYGKVILEIAANVLLILACVKYLRSNSV